LVVIFNGMRLMKYKLKGPKEQKKVSAPAEKVKIS